MSKTMIAWVVYVVVMGLIIGAGCSGAFAKPSLPSVVEPEKWT